MKDLRPFAGTAPMSDRDHPVPLLRAKLRRPPVARDVVRRGELHSRLDDCLRVPLGLVVAPAGYGKSTLVSQWLEECGKPSAWLTLDEGESEVDSFCRYLIAAVRTLHPDACDETLTLLDSGSVPSATLAAYLLSDLEALDGELLIALDDLHRARGQGVSDLLDRLLQHVPERVHFVATARRDPPLSLARMRARDQVVEIRMDDLRFDEPLTLEFLSKASGRELDPGAARRIHERTEGWPVALRLAALALRDPSTDTASFVDGLAGDSLHVQQYLMAELLEHQSPAMQRRLCETSILARFCAPWPRRCRGRVPARMISRAGSSSASSKNPACPASSWGAASGNGFDITIYFKACSRSNCGSEPVPRPSRTCGAGP